MSKPETDECIECDERVLCVLVGEDAPFQKSAICLACLQQHVKAFEDKK